MRLKSLVLALTAAGGVASAQPGPPPQPPPPPMDTTTTTTTTTDPAPPEQPQPPPAPEPQPIAAAEAVDDSRPVGTSIALGFGYGLPTSLETPNRTSLRLRLASGLTFEPLVAVSNTSATMDPPIGTSTTDKVTAFGVDVLMRLPIVTHGKVDLEALGTAGFLNQKTNPDGDFNATTVTSFQLGYGVGVAYWISRHWNFSLSVTNPLVEYRQTKNQGGGPDMTQKASETTLGIVFVPSVFMMIHLYN